MLIKFGNMTVKEFATAVGADFTAEELDYLESKRSDIAEFTDPEAFHIFNDPAISIHLGQLAYQGRVVEVFKAANDRVKFNREVSFHIETRAASEAWIESLTS